jgi:hypothetical protein
MSCLEFIVAVLVDVEDMFFSGVTFNRVVDVPWVVFGRNLLVLQRF